LDFGTASYEVDEEVLSGGWFNYIDKTLRQRAEEMQPEEDFETVFPDIVQYVNKLAPSFEKPAYDGKVNFSPHSAERFTVGNQCEGKRINRRKLYADILTVLRQNNYPNIKAEFDTVYPTPPQKIIDGIVKRGAFSTSFPSNPPRENNIALALKAFDGLTVEAGQEISFNQIVGARTENRGYQEAKIIVKGEYVEGVGGGVCQASTTLFNAVVSAGLHITESHGHSLRSYYVPLGHDAMVSVYNDLRFVNNTGAPIYFETAVQSNRAFVTIFGRSKGDNVQYKLSADVTKEYSPKEELDEENTSPQILADYKKNPSYFDKEITENGEPGYAVTTYIEIWKGSRLLSKKVLRKSTYQSRPIKFKPVMRPMILQQSNFYI
jgi:vancomycin resistance protein YoaR